MTFNTILLSSRDSDYGLMYFTTFFTGMVPHSNCFNSLNINLENSDLVLNLPDTAYHFTYTGTRSNLKYPKRLDAKVMESYESKMINGYNKSRNTNSSISISAKFSDVVMN